MCSEMSDERNKSAARYSRFYFRTGLSPLSFGTHLRRRGNNPSTCLVCYQLLSSLKTSGPALEPTQASIYKVQGVTFREGKADRS